MGPIKKFFKKLRGKPTSRFLCDNPKLKGFEIGAFSYGKPSVRFEECGAALKVGSYCSIASDVVILLGGQHHMEWATTYPFDINFAECRGNEDPFLSQSKGDVVIGHDVWIGHGALICSGVTIGHGAVIGARTVVTKDVPAYAIVAGNPARHIRFRFDEPTRSRLLALKWWDWPFETIVKAWPLMKTMDLDTLETFRTSKGLP